MRKLFTTMLLCFLSYGMYAQVYTLPFLETFDSFPYDDVTFGPGAEPFALLNGWVNVQAGDDAQDWYGRRTPTGSSNTGPTADHTQGGPPGVYMFIEDGFGTFTNIQLESPGIDLSAVAGGVNLEYWAHSWTLSATGNSMMVDVWDGAQWITSVDSFSILSTTDQWFLRSVDLTPYTGDTIKVRFRGTNNVTSFQHDIAIDDVNIYQTVLTVTPGMVMDVPCNGDTNGWATVNVAFPSGPVTYLWSNGSTNDTLMNVGAGTYCVVVTDSAGAVDSACVTITEPGPLMGFHSVMNPTVCFGDSNASIMVDSGMGGAPFSLCGATQQTCAGSTDTVQIGTGTLTNGDTGYPSPFGNWYWGSRHQMMYRASELYAAGVQPGLIKGISINVDSFTTGTTVYLNWTIKAGCATDSTLDAGWVDNLDVVLAPDTAIIDTGWNWFAFDTPVIWDGVSDLVIETCHNNANFTRNPLIPYTNTGYTSVRYYRADNAIVCGSTTTTGTSANRPNMRFSNCPASLVPYTVVWNTGDTTAVLDNVGPGSYSYTMIDGNGCMYMDSAMVDEAVPVSLMDMMVCDGEMGTLDAGPFNSYMWTTGDSTQTIMVPSVTATYGVTVMDSIGCMSMDSAMITAAANPTVSLGADTTACDDGSGLMLDAGAGFTGYMWNNGDSTQMTTATMTGMYDVMVTDTNGCMGMDTIMITLNPNPSISLGADTAVCDIDLPYTLDAGAGFDTYLWSDNSTMQTLDVNAAGTYSVMVTDANGCMGSDTINITIDVCVGIDGMTTLGTKVYPNPTTGLLNVDISDVYPSALDIRVFDMAGRLMKVETMAQPGAAVKVQLDLGELPQGVYHLHIQNEGRSSVHRITIH